MSYAHFPLSSDQVLKRKVAWEGLANRKAFGWAAVCSSTKPDLAEVAEDLPPEDGIPLAWSSGMHPEWDAEIRTQVRALHAAALSRYQDDSYPAIAIPRPVHGQSQAIAELFGCRLIPQESEQNLYFPVPWIEKPSDLDRLRIKPVELCLYGKAIEFTEYAFKAVNGELSIRNPVMTGPIDCANYILGTMQLMHWIYDEPSALHRLLAIITEVLIGIILKLQASAGGRLCPDHCVCLPSGFALCSEVRHLISLDMYKEFESPYLRKIGRECGKYMLHSCGTWERTLSTDMQDENLMMVHFQTKEMNLAKVYDYTKGNLSLYVGPSVNLGDEYIWPDEASFYRHLIAAFPVPIPLSFSIGDIDSYLTVQEELGGGPSGMFNWKVLQSRHLLDVDRTDSA
jgi:hypothetical protein